MQVAVKVLKGQVDETMRKVRFYLRPRIVLHAYKFFSTTISYFNQRLYREIRVWTDLNHPNITPFLGISNDFDRADTPCLISPYYRHGNIVEYLKAHQNVPKLPLVSHVVRCVDHMLTQPLSRLHRLLER